MKQKLLALTLLLFFCFVTYFELGQGIKNSQAEPQLNSKYRLLVTHKNGLGEKEMAERIRLAASNLGIRCKSYNINANFFIRRLFPVTKDLFLKQFDPNIIIALENTFIDYPKAKQYAALTHGSDYYFSSKSSFPIQYLMDFNGFLVAFPDSDKLITYCSFLNKECQSIKWYTTCFATPFTPPKNFHLFYCGCNMANTSFGQKYKSLFSMLNRTDYFRVYGNKNEWWHMPNSYRGLIKNDGRELITIMNKTGVTLILHGPDHLYGKTPTARIFEAAAASNVIISDKNPFIMQEFGDSILYIDHEKSGEVIFEQIDSHMKWIRSHPKEALEKAAKAHAIFIEKFTLEKQLASLLSLHKTVKKSKLKT